MAGTFTVNGDGTITVRFEYTAATQKVQDTIGDAGEFLWSIGIRAPSTPAVGTYDELTNQQKLDIVDFYIRQDVINKAKGQYVTDALAAAETTAETEAETRYL